MTTLERAELRFREIDTALKIVCIKYDIKLEDFCCIRNEIYLKYRYRFETIANGRNTKEIELINMIMAEYESEHVWFYKQLRIRYVDYGWSPIYMQCEIKDNENAIDAIIEFFRENNILTRDEMIIKDIIE